MNLKSAIHNIIHGRDDYFLITQGINTLYDAFSEATTIFAGDLTHEKMKETANGKVVTPVQAAHCLKDIGRSMQFYRAIHQAINYYLSHKKTKPVRILYAGCGPYATLLTPFTSLYSPDQIQFTFLEIEEIAYQAVKKLYEDWKIDSFLESVKLCDATDQNLEPVGFFDIILSETMQVGLKNECQVPVTQNLVRFLSDGGTFIPQQIKLDVYLTGKPKDPLVPNSVERIFVGTAYDLDYRNLPSRNHVQTLQVPEANLEFLKLYTDICLFDELTIKPYASSLTRPLILDRLMQKKAGRKIKFQYMQSARPDLYFEYVTD